jgi:hypothetical protein
MPMTDELQELFDGALASMPPSTPPPISGLHDRLRKRRFKRRLALVGASVAVVLLGLGIGLTGAPSQPAGAVVLRVAPGTEASHRDLAADVTVMRTRLALFGDSQATVSVSGNKIIVTGAPAELSDPSSPLTQSPSLLVRPVLCYSGPYESSSTATAGSLPSDCGPYAIPKTVPETYPGGAHGAFTPFFEPDPALASIPSTTPAEDLANPDAIALLPSSTPTRTQYPRDLVGPTELSLSSSVATAQVVQDPYGNWGVKVQLGTTAASQWNDVAERYFHLVLAVDMNGQIVNEAVIQPTQNTYTPFDVLILTGGLSQTQTGADAVAAALQSGPLPIPIRATT